MAPIAKAINKMISMVPKNGSSCAAVSISGVSAMSERLSTNDSAKYHNSAIQNLKVQLFIYCYRCLVALV